MRRGRFDPPRPRLTIRREWMRLWPARPTAFWVMVAERVKERRVRHEDWAKVRGICAEVEAMNDWRAKR